MADHSEPKSGAPQIYEGKCFCGAVEIEARGEPIVMGYCHCKDCRSWSGGPVTTFTLWSPDAVRIKSGREHLATFAKTNNNQRQYCRKCGGHIMAVHPEFELVDILAAALPTLRFQPQLHVNYESTVLRIKDGLPKLKDFPAEHGGSGESLPE